MNQTYISLDLETTGLNAETDAIIEIAAVKFQGNEILDIFDTVVNPGKPIPYHVQWLTGITEEEVANAPSFHNISAELLNFAQDYPIVGHNISFDVEFLLQQGARLTAPLYDTWEMARIILPHLPEYSLVSLARELNVVPLVSHRALADTYTARDLFLILVEKASQLDQAVIADIVRLTETTDWPWRSIFLNLLKENQNQTFIPRPDAKSKWSNLVSNPNYQPIDSKSLTSLLEPDGPVSKAFPAYENRPGQITMMNAIVDALNNNKCLIVEAGTGTGKSLAYLIPAASCALTNNTHVLISTNTISLQEQLINKDIPNLVNTLDTFADLRVTLLKGRTNYICPRQWLSWRETQGLSWEQLRFLLRIMVWLSFTTSGDRAELILNPDEALLWNKICASADNCTQDYCPYRDRQNMCYLYCARNKAERSHLIVVNHALLLSDLINSNKILPEYKQVIIDEAHHLEAEATDQLGWHVGRHHILRLMDRITESNGLRSHVHNWLRSSRAHSHQASEIEKQLAILRQHVKTAQLGTSDCLETILSFCNISSEGHKEYEQRLRITRETRNNPVWGKITDSWEELNIYLENVENGLIKLHALLEDSTEDESLSILIGEASSLHEAIQKLRHQMGSFITSPEDNCIYWVSWKEQDNYLQLNAAPLDVGLPLNNLFFSQKDSVVLTSATLSTEGNFEYIKGCLGLSEVDELIVGTPFDYLSSTMLYLPMDIPEPERPGYRQAMDQMLVNLCQETQGRTLVLFTSHAALRSTYANIQSPLEANRILVLGQAINGSAKQLLNQFKRDQHTVLLGTASMWEGVDIVGDALSVVAIARIPFNVPSDPIFAARCELFNDPFSQYTIPQAALKFKQGFGRLIRSGKDRGVVIILDRRLQSKAYGKVFLDSLPVCTVKRGTLKQIPSEVASWINRPVV